MLDKMAEPEKLDGYLNMVTYSDDWVDFTYGRIGMSGSLLRRRVAKDAIGKFVKDGLEREKRDSSKEREKRDSSRVCRREIPIKQESASWM